MLIGLYRRQERKNQSSFTVPVTYPGLRWKAKEPDGSVIVLDDYADFAGLDCSRYEM